VVDAVEVLRKSTSEEEVKINELRSNLQTITDMTNDVTGETEEMEKMIVNLAKANEDIVGQIQTISAVTQEVTARSSETVDACQENSRLVDEVSRLADTLNADAQKLKASTAEL
jgi:methyl-accepting chemotaxis protein